jgi:ribosomal protein S18 acetylase RimI-like enzyme
MGFPIVFILFMMIFSTHIPLGADEALMNSGGKEISIQRVFSAEEIDLPQAKKILVQAFMSAYEEVPLTELNPEFKCIADVRRFYEHYFESELGHFKAGELIWLQAFEGQKLVGWATFELEKGEDHAIYMNLLAVDPAHQGKGVGKQLTFSIRREDLLPHIREIRLLLRNVNEKGRQFYEKIGFSDFHYKRNDNFVDMSLLTGLRWVAKEDD